MPLIEPFLLHPVAVHFPIALLTVGLAAAAWAYFRKLDRLAEAATWLLWLGAASAWAAMGLGLYAESTAPHVPPAWDVLYDHKHLAFWTVGLFTALSLWRWTRKFQGALLLAWLICWGVLVRTAYLGGEVVYTYGMGVKALYDQDN